MPDNRSPGMLEDFVAGLIRPEDDMLPRVDEFLESLPPGFRRFPESRRSKARIHVWLATSKQPGRPMGQAIRAHANDFIDIHHSTVNSLLQWIHDVFDN
jgi:hypothetical protein